MTDGLKFFESEDRHLAILWLTPELMAEMIFQPRRGIEIKIGGLPHNCRVKGVHYSPEQHAFGFLLLHPSFDEVPCGGSIPSLMVMVTEQDWSHGEADQPAWR